MPLLLFDPVLDWLERYEKAKIAKHGVRPSEYRTTHTNSKIMLALAQKAGLSLRFGGATAVTSTFLMAPIGALMVVLMYQILIDRGVSQGEMAIPTRTSGQGAARPAPPSHGLSPQNTAAKRRAVNLAPVA